MIPSKAYAKLSTRLVPNQNPEKIAKLVERHIRKLLPKSVRCKFEVLEHRDSPGLPLISHPIFQKAIHALEEGFGKRAVFIREGGSIPLSRRCTTPSRFLGVFDGLWLAERECTCPRNDEGMLALENYFGGIKSVALFYEQLAAL